MRTLLIPSTLVALSLVPAAALAQTPAPSTTDCPFAQQDECIRRYAYWRYTEARRESNAHYQRGIRAFAGLTLALGAPQLIGGIYAATIAAPDTNNVGNSIAWVSNGVLLTMTGAVFAALPFDRPTRRTDMSVALAPTLVFGLAAAGHAGWAAATWLAPPQDVDPAVRHVFAASMAANALWYASAIALMHVDARDRRERAWTPYAASDGRSASAGIAGRF